jgi:hypothetical protein
MAGLTESGQSWKCNVEANRFVLTIRDYLEVEKSYGPHQDPSSYTRTDELTAQFTDLVYVHRIKEAFDEDGSGYVTVQEVNRFTEMQPRSLGWRYVTSKFAANYIDRID